MQEKPCFVNAGTGRLHFTGLCRESNYKPSRIQYFDSEDEALAVFGRAMSICKNYSRKRDKQLQEMKGVVK
mgnify:FL=1